MRINPINSYNRSFTSFKVTDSGAKELAEKITQDPEFEKVFTDDVIKPLSYTITNVIYDGNKQIIINPAHNINNYYFLEDKNFMSGIDNNTAILKDLKTGEFISIQLDSDIEKKSKVDVHPLIAKLDTARKVAQQFDQNNPYYIACHSPNNLKATLRYNESKLERLFSINKS